MCSRSSYFLHPTSYRYAYGIYQGYVLEVILHEWLLASPHRTLDPHQADWFYVPVYASCAMVSPIATIPHASPFTTLHPIAPLIPIIPNTCPAGDRHLHQSI